MNSTLRSPPSRRCCHDPQVRAPGRDPAARPGAAPVDAGRGRRGAPRARRRRRAGDGLARHRATRAREGARRVGAARLRDARWRRPRPAERADVGASPLGDVARPVRQPARHPDAAGPCQCARASDRPGAAAGGPRHRRRRQHDHGHRPRGRHRRGGRTTTAPSPGGRYVSKTAVLAYSGGLDTSCAIAWLKEDYGFDTVVAVLVDVGQEADFGPAFERGRIAGADDVLLVDRKAEFAGEHVAKALLANALYEGRYPLVSALSRPVIAAAVAEVALDLGAEAVVHGCTGKGNDQLRFELAFRARYPGVRVIAPLRDRIWTRDEEIAYAEEHGIPVEANVEKPYSVDDNLFGRAIEAGILEDPWEAPPEDAFLLTAAPGDAPTENEIVIEFEHGLPVAL